VTDVTRDTCRAAEGWSVASLLIIATEKLMKLLYFAAEGKAALVKWKIMA
jgi:hypothetical protein